MNLESNLKKIWNPLKSFLGKESLKYVFFGLFLAFFLFSSYLIFINRSASIPYPYDQWVKHYDKIWISLSGDQDTILKRKNFVENFSKYFNTKYPRYKAEYVFTPTFDKKYDFLFVTLESLKKEKELLTNASGELVNQSIFRDYKILESLDFLGTEVLSSAEPNSNPEISFLDPPSETKEFVYDSSSVLANAFPQGEEVKIKFRIQNLSAETWVKDKIFLLTTDPDLSKSILYNDKSWAKDYLPGTMVEGETAPSEIATFEFLINTNIPIGKYNRQYFTLGMPTEDPLVYRRLGGDSIYFNFDVYPDFNLLRKDLNNFSDFNSFYKKIKNIESADAINFDDVRNLLNQDILKYDVLEKEELASSFLDYKGFITTKNEETILFSITPKYGFENLDDLSYFVQIVEKELSNSKIPEGIKVDVLGVPKQIQALFPETQFGLIWQVIVFVFVLIGLTILFGRFLLPTVILGVSFLFGIISALASHILIFGPSSYLDQVWYLILLSPLAFIYLVFFFKILDFKAVQNIRELQHIVEVVISKYKKIFLLYLLFYFVFSSTVLIFWSDLIFIKIVVWILLNIIFAIVILFWFFPTLISLISKSSWKKFLHLRNYLDFSFVSELISTPFRFSISVLILFLLLYGLIFSRVNFVSFTSGFPWDKEVRRVEEFISLKFGFNLLYPLKIPVTNYESLKSLDAYATSSKIFKTYDNIFTFIPSNQEEKIGLLQSYLKDIDFKELLKNDPKGIDSYDVFTENLNSALTRIENLIDLNNEIKLYRRSREERLINNTKTELEEILADLSKEEMSAKISKIELEVDNYIKSLYRDKQNYLSVKTPLTIQDFSDDFKSRYLTANAYLDYLFTFGSIFDSKTRELVKTELSSLGVEAVEQELLSDVFVFHFWRFLIGIFMLLVLPVILARVVLLKKYKRIGFVLLLNVFFLVFTNSIFNLFKFSFEYITVINFITVYSLFNLFVLSSLVESEDTENINNAKEAYRALIIIIFTHGIITLLSIIFNIGGNEESKVLLFLFSLLFSIFVIYPVLYGSIFNYKSFLAKTSRMHSLNQVDNMVETTPASFSKKYMSFAFSYSKIRNYFNDYFRNLEIKKVNSNLNKENTEITEGQRKLIDFFNFYRLKETFLTKFIQSKDLVNTPKLQTKKNSSEADKADLKTDAVAEVQEVSEVINNVIEKPIVPKNTDQVKRKEKRFVEKADIETEENYDFGFSKYIPIHVFETDLELTIEAEIREINIYDVDVFLDNNILRIKSSDTYKGTPFERHIAINVPIQSSKININVDQGELIISIPKILEAKSEEAVSELSTKPSEEILKASENTLNTDSPVLSDEKIDSGEETQRHETTPIENYESKSNLLKDIMAEDEDISANKSTSSAQNQEAKNSDLVKIDYELKSLEDDMTLIIFLKQFKSDDFSLSLANKSIKIRNSSKFLGAPFALEVPLERSLVYESIKTEINERELVITAKYRPNFISVAEIEDQGQS